MLAARSSPKRSPTERRPPGGEHPAGTVSASDEGLDEALELTFPASDPPAQTQAIVHVGIKTTKDARRRPLTQR
jgi:hypothetical protein